MPVEFCPFSKADILIFIKKYVCVGVPIVAQWLTNPTSIHEDAGSIPGLPQCVKDLMLL